MSYIDNLHINPYIFTDSAAKAVLIDGAITFGLLSIPMVLKPVLPEYAYSFVTLALPEVQTKHQFAFAMGVNIIFAGISYVIRDYTRDFFKQIGYENFGGIIGGATKYAGIELTNQYSRDYISPLKIISRGVLGAFNNYLYELCSTKDTCKNDSNFIIRAETNEAFIQSVGSFVLNVQFPPDNEDVEKVVADGVSGMMAGILAVFSIEYLYVPLIDSIHNISDTAYNGLISITGLNTTVNDEL